MVQARCSRCSKLITRKTSTETLCLGCDSEDRIALATVLNYMKESEDYSRTTYELSNDLESVDEARLRRWLRLGWIEECGVGQVCLPSGIKARDNRPLATVLRRLSEPDAHSFPETVITEPMLVIEDLVIHDS